MLHSNLRTTWVTWYFMVNNILTQVNKETNQCGSGLETLFFSCKFADLRSRDRDTKKIFDLHIYLYKLEDLRAHLWHRDYFRRDVPPPTSTLFYSRLM
jgi:hypothetical protein